MSRQATVEQGVRLSAAESSLILQWLDCLTLEITSNICVDPSDPIYNSALASALRRLERAAKTASPRPFVYADRRSD